MTLQEFLSYSIDDQYAIIMELGTHVADRHDGYSNIKLYMIDSFYAEVFSRVKDGIIWKFGGFDHPVLLHPYLEQVDIQHLLQSDSI